MVVHVSLIETYLLYFMAIGINARARLHFYVQQLFETVRCKNVENVQFVYFNGFILPKCPFAQDAIVYSQLQYNF